MRRRELIASVLVCALTVVASLSVALACSVMVTPANLSGTPFHPATPSQARAVILGIDLSAVPEAPREHLAAFIADAEMPRRLVNNGREDRAFGYHVVTTVARTEQPDRFTQLSRFEFGWPIPTMAASTVLHVHTQTDYAYMCVGGSMTANPFPQTARVIPHRVLWLNLLLTVVGAWAATVLPALVFRSIRIHVRLRRNLCPGCGYPIGTSNTCSECGVAPRSSS